MNNHHISVPKADLILAMDELRLSGRDYYADLLKKALFSAPVSAEPVAQVAEDFIFFLRKQPNGERWPVDTKLYAALIATPVSAEPVAHAMEAIMGYRLEFKPGEYCYYTPEGYALEAYKGDAPAHALYANPQPGCPSEIEVYKGWCWVRPKYNFGNIVDETFRPLFLGPQLGAPVAAQAPVFSVGVRGVGLIDDNPSALAIYFYAAPNNDDIRALHEVVSGTPVAAQAQPTRRELDMAMLIKNLARQVRRAEPYGTNYHRISDDALDALKRWGLDGSPVRTTKPEGTQSQQVDKSTEMQRQLVDRTPDLHRQQQPESSADQFRDAAQMIEPSGNSGGLPVSVRDALDWYAQQVGNCRRFGTAGDAARADLDADGGRRARAALAQQDADKVDATPPSAHNREMSAIGRAKERVAESLPEMWAIQISIEAGAGTVHLIYPDSSGVLIDSGEPLSEQINEAYDQAIDAARKEQA